MSEVVEGCGLFVCVSRYRAHKYVHIGTHKKTHTTWTFGQHSFPPYSIIVDSQRHCKAPIPSVNTNDIQWPQSENLDT